MSDQQVSNLNVLSQDVLITPETLKQEIPLSEAAEHTVIEGRRTIQNILDGSDPRLLVVIGPCSIHDVDAALDYARRLRRLADEVKDSLFVVMRVYFEKPRTTVGWKGLINDPHLNGSFEIEEGLHIARRLLVELSELGLPLATEALDPISPQYLQDCISWSAIGARTTESQLHRELASGLEAAVGFKNGTGGDIQVALDAMRAAAHPHQHVALSAAGRPVVRETAGNPHSHLVLRGGHGGPNHDRESVRACREALEAAGLTPRLMVDCSHANACKDHRRQGEVLRDVIDQRLSGETALMGLMLESHLEEGKQPLAPELRYGVSVTDACLGWESTEHLLLSAAERLR